VYNVYITTKKENVRMEKLRRKVYNFLSEYRHFRDIGFMPWLEMQIAITARENYEFQHHDEIVAESYKNMNWFVKLCALFVWGKEYVIEDLDACVRDITQDYAEDYEQRKFENYWG